MTEPSALDWLAGVGVSERRRAKATYILLGAVTAGLANTAVNLRPALRMHWRLAQDAEVRSTCEELLEIIGRNPAPLLAALHPLVQQKAHREQNARAGIVAVTEHNPKRWLDQWPKERRSTISNDFHNAVRNGAGTPEEVVARAADSVRRRLENAWLEEDKRDVFACVLASLEAAPASALQYAEWVLWYEALPEEEQRKIKAARSSAAREEWMEGQPATEKQIAYLRRLGHRGEAPHSKLEASKLIDQLLNKS